MPTAGQTNRKPGRPPDSAEAGAPGKQTIRSNDERRRVMFQLMERAPFGPDPDADSQAKGFTARALKPGAKLWSKAGWTSETRHDAAYVELPGGAKFILVTFTVGHANERDIIPSVARRVVAGME